MTSICIARCAPPCARCESTRHVLSTLVAGPEIHTGICMACGTIWLENASRGGIQCACGAAIVVPTRPTAESLAGGLASRKEHELARASEADTALQWAAPTAETLAALVRAYAAALGDVARAPDPSGGYRAGAAGGEVSADRRIAWLAARIDEVLTDQNQPLAARPFLETVVDRARDDGFRLIALARLARVAERSTNPEAALAWLALCPPEAPGPALDAPLRVARAWHALGARRLTEAEALTRAFDRYPLSWPEQLALALAHVVCAEHSGHSAAAEDRLRRTLADHMAVDVQALLAREPVLSPVRAVWTRLDERERKKALLPVKAAGAFSILLMLLSLVLVPAAESYQLECQRNADGKTADCVIHEHIGGVPTGRRTVRGLSGTRLGHVGKASNRVELLTQEGVVIVDRPADDQAKYRKARLDLALADRDVARFDERWDHDVLLLFAAIGATTAVLIALLALVRFVRIRTAPSPVG